MNPSIPFLVQYCDFSHPHWVWVLEGMSRRKDNPGEYHDFMQRLVVTCPEDIEKCYTRLLWEMNDPATTYRIYVSLNARDSVKTVFSFQHELLEIGGGLAKGQQDALVKAKKIGSLWKTELLQNGNRATKRILLDVDVTGPAANQVLAWVDTHRAVIRANRQTPNGRHIVIDACDTRDLVKFCKDLNIPLDVQRDSLLFVELLKKA